MIDVPVEVKDALREGTYKKNYRFVVGEEEWHEVGSIETKGRYSPSIYDGDDEKYTIRDTTKTYRFVVDDAEHDNYTLYCWQNSGGSWYTIEPVARNTWDVTVTSYPSYVEINNASENLVKPVSVQNYYAETIDNNNLVSESVNIDERMCSGDTLKFGLCEGSSLEFQYFDKPNITGQRVQAFVDVDYGADEPYTIPMGFFDVKKCSRQASTGIIKATCYNKLQSEYLDAKANETVAELVAQGEYGYTDRLSLYTLLKELLDGYGIEEDTYSYSQASVSSFGGANLVTIPLCDASGQSTSSKLFLYMSSSSFSLNRDDFYHFYLYTQELKQHCIDEVWGSYKTLYTKVNDTVYTIEQFADTSYTDAWYLCGQIYCRKKVDINTFFFERKGGRSNAYTSEYSECYEIEAMIPVHASVGTTPPVVNLTVWRNYFNQVWGEDYVFADIYKKELSAAQKVRITTSEMESIQDVTLRELQSSVYELSCQFGQLSRVTDLFSGVELNHSRLYPADSLYPATDLYPSGAAASGFKSMYSKLWADEGNVHKWRYLIITYKGLNGDDQEEDFTLQRTINADGTDDYNMSDNWLFRNLVWTAAQVGDYADAMVAKMQDVTWFPFEMWCAGLPYIETGDEIEIPLGEHSYTSYVLQRQLKGIQNLQDTYINGTLDIF